MRNGNLRPKNHPFATKKRFTTRSREQTATKAFLQNNGRQNDRCGAVKKAFETTLLPYIIL